MIEHLRHADIDKRWWDAQLARCADRNWYAQSHVLDAAAPGWDALVDRDRGALMPLTWRRRYGVRYLFQPYGLQQLGVFAPTPDAARAEEFLHAIPKEFRYWDICLHASTHALSFPAARITEGNDQLLSLTGDALALRAAYGENHRRNVRKAQAAEGFFTTAIDPAEFVALFARTTGERFGNGRPRDMDTMHALIMAAAGKGEVVRGGIRKEGVLHAAICWIRHEDRIILFKSASDEAGQGMKAMFHLIDRMIGEQAGSGRTLDFAGSNTASVARFYAGFGARPSVYLRLVLNRLPIPFKWLKQ